MPTYCPPMKHEQHRKYIHVQSPVSTPPLNALLHVHVEPIDLVVFEGDDGDTLS